MLLYGTPLCATHLYALVSALPPVVVTAKLEPCILLATKCKQLYTQIDPNKPKNFICRTNDMQLSHFSDRCVYSKNHSSGLNFKVLYC